eukprot:GHVP01023336.1.p2 GENE.GHVP01023336.1~~GHVP01023336.1.p2  ORF type:complete len:215 (-),score=9.08 GHVP01023336.1:2024-2668(-)
MENSRRISRVLTFPAEQHFKFNDVCEIISDSLDPNAFLRKEALIQFQPRSQNPITVLIALQKILENSTTSTSPSNQLLPDFPKLPTESITTILSDIIEHPLLEHLQNAPPPPQSQLNRPNEIKFALDAPELGVSREEIIRHAMVVNALIRRARLDQSQSRTKEIMKKENLLSLILGLGHPTRIIFTRSRSMDKQLTGYIVGRSTDSTTKHAYHL